MALLLYWQCYVPSDLMYIAYLRLHSWWYFSLVEDFDQSELGHGRGYMLQKVAEHILFLPGLVDLTVYWGRSVSITSSSPSADLPYQAERSTRSTPKVCVFDAVQDAGLYGDDNHVPAVGQTQASTGSTATAADYRTRASDFPWCKFILQSFFLRVVFLQ